MLDWDPENQLRKLGNNNRLHCLSVKRMPKESNETKRKETILNVKPYLKGGSEKSFASYQNENKRNRKRRT